MKRISNLTDIRRRTDQQFQNIGFKVSRLMFEVKLEKPYKTCVKHTILNLGHALITRYEAPRMHKPHECHLEGSGEHLGASCGPPGSHLVVEVSHACIKALLKNNPTTPLTIQPQALILQPGLAECAKPLK